MDYLFFDIECANSFNGSGKICEFGYVITDEIFTVKEKKIWLVDPADGFDWYVVKNMLAYPVEQYRAAETYPAVFPKIRQLFEHKDVLILGHTVDADAGYLNDEAKRYGLPFFQFRFYDVKEMFSEYANAKGSVGLEKIGELLGTSGPSHAHKSVDDAEATMEAVKAMCLSLETTLEELIDLCPDCQGETKNGEVRTPKRERAKAAREERFKEAVAANRIEKRIAKRFVNYRNKLKINPNAVSVLAGRVVCFSRNYEDSHLKEMLFLVKKLADNGAKCVGKASDCDLFVRDDFIDENGQTRFCTRLAAVEIEMGEGRSIRIVTMHELLQMLGMTEEDLANVPVPDEETMTAPAARQNGSRCSTIGEILAASSVRLNYEKGE